MLSSSRIEWLTSVSRASGGLLGKHLRHVSGEPSQYP